MERCLCSLSCKRLQGCECRTTLHVKDHVGAHHRQMESQLACTRLHGRVRSCNCKHLYVHRFMNSAASCKTVAMVDVMRLRQRLAFLAYRPRRWTFP